MYGLLSLCDYRYRLAEYRLFMQKESSIGHNRMSVSVSLKK